MNGNPNILLIDDDPLITEPLARSLRQHEFMVLIAGNGKDGLQMALDDQPDIVVLQFGENLAGGTMAQLTTAMDGMLTGLKNSSNPNIFITSSILGANATVDAIKQQACAADPSRRVFVDLNGRVDNSGVAGHPSDAGMQTIADTIFNAMAVVLSWNQV